jgi:GNAT superfamily N-acetyltransferase
MVDASSDDVLERDDVNRVVYRIMKPDDAASTLATMAKAFHEGEPLTAASGATLKDMRAFCQLYIPRMAEEGNSVLAVDKDTGDILGAFLNEDFCNPDPPDFMAFMKSADSDFNPLLGMVEELETELNKLYAIPREAAARAPGRWFHLWLLGVVPVARGRRVGVKLAANSVAWAQTRGFELAFAETTGAVSTTIMGKHAGATAVHFLDYAAFKGEVRCMQGYLAHKKLPPPLGPP